MDRSCLGATTIVAHSWAYQTLAMGAGRGAEEEAAMQDPTIGPNSRLAEFRNKVLESKTDRTALCRCQCLAALPRPHTRTGSRITDARLTRHRLWSAC